MSASCCCFKPTGRIDGQDSFERTGTQVLEGLDNVVGQDDGQLIPAIEGKDRIECVDFSSDEPASAR